MTPNQNSKSKSDPTPELKKQQFKERSALATQIFIPLIASDLALKGGQATLDGLAQLAWSASVALQTKLDNEYRLMFEGEPTPIDSTMTLRVVAGLRK